MTRLVRMVTIASVFACVLPPAACSSFDPSDIVDNIFAAQKKPLVGERKPLFPSGTPGVQQGLPPELVKGYRAPADAAPSDNANAAAPDEPKPKPKAKPKPKVAAAPPASTPASAPAAPAYSRPAPAQASPWPDPPRQPAGPGQVAWPDPPPATR